MYRQIVIKEVDQDFHRLLWREKISDEIKVYRMTRVTYGLASSCYHSVRALQDAADSCSNPEVEKVIKRDFYVDDLLSGAGTMEEAKRLQQGVFEQLLSRNFKQRKWSSNRPEITDNLLEKLSENAEAFSIKDKSHNLKTLGMRW